MCANAGQTTIGMVMAPQWNANNVLYIQTLQAKAALVQQKMRANAGLTTTGMAVGPQWNAKRVPKILGRTGRGLPRLCNAFVM